MNLQVPNWYFRAALSCICHWTTLLTSTLLTQQSGPDNLLEDILVSFCPICSRILQVRVQEKMKRAQVSSCQTLDTARVKCWNLLLNFKVQRKPTFLQGPTGKWQQMEISIHVSRAPWLQEYLVIQRYTHCVQTRIMLAGPWLLSVILQRSFYNLPSGTKQDLAMLTDRIIDPVAVLRSKNR